MPMRAKQNGTLQVAVVTVCLEPQLLERITGMLQRLPWLLDVSHLDSYSSATRRPAFGPQMRVADAGLVFVDYATNVDQAIDCSRYLAQAFGPKVAVVAIGDDREPELILEAMRAGCSEYLSHPVTESLLEATLQRFQQRWISETGPAEQSGSVLAVVGAKGGVGATTLAVHLAHYLCTEYGKKVLFVDAHPELGHACLLLGMEGAQITFDEVVQNVNRLDSDLLQGFVGRHASGLAVLSSPDTPVQRERAERQAVAKTLEFLRSEYDYVVIDCDRARSETSQAVLDFAARIYLVATPEICAVRDLSRHVDRILHENEAAERTHVVLNRASSQAGLDSLQIEKALRFPIALRVPNNYAAFIKAGNTGHPIPARSGTDVSQEIRRWASSLVQLPQAVERTEPKRAGFLGLLARPLHGARVKGAHA